MMRPVAKELWVKALRSGDYEQGKSGLQDETGRYCCLGVLCEVAISAGVQVRKNLISSNYFWGYDDTSVDLPPSVLDWAGLEDNDPFVMYDGHKTSLIRMNDGLSCNFREIADAIEADDTL